MGGLCTSDGSLNMKRSKQALSVAAQTPRTPSTLFLNIRVRASLPTSLLHRRIGKTWGLLPCFCRYARGSGTEHNVSWLERSHMFYVFCLRVLRTLSHVATHRPRLPTAC